MLLGFSAIQVWSVCLHLELLHLHLNAAGKKGIKKWTHNLWEAPAGKNLSVVYRKYWVRQIVI